MFFFRDLFSRKYLTFHIVATLYLLWIIWVGSEWLLLGFPVIYDLFITRKIKWLFWKKRVDGKYLSDKKADWIDAVLFALIAAVFVRIFCIEAFTIPSSSMEKTLIVGDYLFVSKLNYGPRMPMTPLSLPFTQKHLPFLNQIPSYSEAVTWPFKRLAGLSHIRRNDVVVFNFPEGDTIVPEYPGQSYYTLIRQYGREFIQNQFSLVYRPVDMRETFIKRCIGLPADTLHIIHGIVWINRNPLPVPQTMEYNYFVRTDGTPLSDEFLKEQGINRDERHYNEYNSMYELPLTIEDAEKLKELPFVKYVTRYENTHGMFATNTIYPFSSDYQWTEDNFGPFIIPAKGMTVNLTARNLPLYARIISAYEKNNLQVKNDTVYINHIPAESYTFKMDYYFMMGDNRHNSADSRFWGCVPENHIIGKAFLIWLSIDKNKKAFHNIRWNRMFKKIH